MWECFPVMTTSLCNSQTGEVSTESWMEGGSQRETSVWRVNPIPARKQALKLYLQLLPSWSLSSGCPECPVVSWASPPAQPCCLPQGGLCLLTLTSPHSVTYTILQDHVFGTQSVHLQVQLVLGVISRDGKSDLNRVGVAHATTNTNVWDPLPPSLGPGGPSSYSGYWQWIQSPQRRISEIPQAVPAAPHTSHLQRQRYQVPKLSPVHCFY